MNNKKAIQEALTSQLYSTSNLALVISVTLAVILGYVQRDVIASGVILAWVLFITLVSLVRIIFAISYQKASIKDTTANQSWLIRFRIGVFISGVAWGSAGFLLFPVNSLEHQIFLVFTLAGLTAGGVVSYAADMISAVAFNVALILPLMIRFSIADDSLSIAMGLALVLYLGFMITSLRYINRYVTENILMRLESAEREKAAKISEEKLRGLYELFPMGIALTDMNGRYIEFNESMCRICGYSEDELKALDYWKLTPRKYEADEARQLETLSNTGHYGPYEKEYIRKDGTLIPLCLNGLIVTGHDGQKYIWSIIEDITERKKAEKELLNSRDELEGKVIERTIGLQSANTALIAEKEHREVLIRKLAEANNQLLQSEKMASIGQLAAGVAHEINNPIGFVSSNLETLKKYIADLLLALSAYEESEREMTSTRREVLAELKRKIDIVYLREDVGNLLSESMDGLQRVKRIVQDLKSFSHVGETEMQWADLEQGLDSTLNVIWNELKYKTEVVKEYAGIPKIECIASQINQVFMNLLMNAVQAIEFHGRITIRTGQQDDNVWVEVEDTGKGIKPEHIEHIFDPFFTTKPVGTGTGLGLSLSYDIVQKHGGRIEVKSEPGKGSVLRVVLPMSR